MGRKLSEINSEIVGGHENLSFLKKIFSQKLSYNKENEKLPGKPISNTDIPGQVLKVKLNKKIFFCQIRMDNNLNYHCVSYVENDDGMIELSSFTMIYFSGKDNMSLEDIVNKYNFSQTLYNCEIIYNM